MNQTRDQREAAIAAELDADRIIRDSQRLGVDLMHIAAMILAAVLVFVAVLLAGHAPAHAATRPVYKGTVTIVYGQGVNDGYSLGAKFTASRWDVKAAAAAAGVGKVRVVKINTQRECYEVGGGYCAFIATSPDAIYDGNYYPGKPYRVLLVKDCWKGHCALLESQVSMSDRVGARSTAAQRQAWLVAAIRAGVPR